MIIIQFNSYDFKISNTLNFLKGIDSILKDTEIANKIEFKDCLPKQPILLLNGAVIWHASDSF